MHNQVSNGALLPPPDIAIWILQQLQAGIDLKKFPCSALKAGPSPLLLPPYTQSISNQPRIPEFDWKFAPNVKIGEALTCARYRLTEAGISAQAAYKDALAILDALMQQCSKQESLFSCSTLTEKQAKLYKKKLVDRINGQSLNDIVKELKQMETSQE